MIYILVIVLVVILYYTNKKNIKKLMSYPDFIHAADELHIRAEQMKKEHVDRKHQIFIEEFEPDSWGILEIAKNHIIDFPLKHINRYKFELEESGVPHGYLAKLVITTDAPKRVEILIDQDWIGSGRIKFIPATYIEDLIITKLSPD